MALKSIEREKKKALYWIPRYVECARLIGALLCDKGLWTISLIKFVYLLVLVESYYVSNISLRQSVRKFHSDAFFFDANAILRERGENVKYAFHTLELLTENNILRCEAETVTINRESELFVGVAREVADRFKLSEMLDYVLRMSNKQFAKEVISHDPY